MELPALLQLFDKGGLVMYPLLACSVAVLAMALERYWYYRAHRTDTARLWPALADAIDNDDWRTAMEICHDSPGDIAVILTAALRRRSAGHKGLRSFLETEASVAAARLRDRLGLLEAIVTLAPLLGLLGTIVGMIQSFSVLAIRAGQPLAITGGVGEALIATGTGLSVAIFAFVVHGYFVYDLDRMVTDMEQIFGWVISSAERDSGYEAT